MTKQEKRNYAAAETIGYYCRCNFGGLEIIGIEYGINDAVIVCDNYGEGRKNIGRYTLRETSTGRTYFKRYGRRYYLSDFMRF